MEEDKTQITLKKVNDFLQKLGLNPTAHTQSASYWENFHQIIERETGQSMAQQDLSDPMSEGVVDLFFSTPALAAMFLSSDLIRLQTLLISLDAIYAWSKPPKAVAEIGGGPGIASLWLAQRYPGTQFTVFDQSANALSVGQHWAKTLNLPHVHFIKKSYRDLAQQCKHGAYDLVLGLGALNLNVLEENGKPHLNTSMNPDDIDSALIPVIKEFCNACRSLLNPDGMLYFSQGSINDLGLLCLFHAFRACHLGIDWQHTHGVTDGSGPGLSLKAIHLFVKPGISTVFSHAHDDLSVFLYSAQMNRFEDKIMLGHGDFEPWLGLLSDGVKLADLSVLKKDGLHERFSIYVKSGMLGFFSSHSKGGRSGFIFNAASFESAVSRLVMIVERYKQQNITLTHIYLHPYFQNPL